MARSSFATSAPVPQRSSASPCSISPCCECVGTHHAASAVAAAMGAANNKAFTAVKADLGRVSASICCTLGATVYPPLLAQQSDGCFSGDGSVREHPRSTASPPRCLDTPSEMTTGLAHQILECGLKAF